MGNRITKLIKIQLRYIRDADHPRSSDLPKLDTSYMPFSSFFTVCRSKENEKPIFPDFYGVHAVSCAIVFSER